MEAPELCKLIGGDFSEFANKVENGCAIRLSYAMNKAEFYIPHVAGTYKGGNGNWCFIKASEMGRYLKKWYVASVKNSNFVKNGLTR